MPQAEERCGGEPCEGEPGEAVDGVVEAVDDFFGADLPELLVVELELEPALLFGGCFFAPGPDDDAGAARTGEMATNPRNPAANKTANRRRMETPLA